MGLNLLFIMGETNEETIKQTEPITYALFKWLEAMSCYTIATYPGDETHDYRSLSGDRLSRARNFDFDEQREELQEM